MNELRADIYNELDEKTYNLLLERAEKVSAEYLERIMTSISGDAYSQWQIPDRIDLIHGDIDRHYYANKDRFDMIFDHRPAYKEASALKEEGYLKTDAASFAAVAIIYDDAMRKTQTNLLKITDNLMGKIRAMSPERRLDSEEMEFLERINASKIMDGVASMAALRRRDIEGLGLRNISVDLAAELSTPSKTWEKRLGEEKSLVRYVFAEAKINEEVFGRHSGIADRFLKESAEKVQDFRISYRLAMQGLDMGLESDPYSQLEEKQKETLISDGGLIQTDLRFIHSSSPSNYEGMSIHELSRKEQIDFLSTAISEYCQNRIKEDGGDLENIVSESLTLSDELLKIYSEKFKIAHLDEKAFKDEVKSFGMLKAAINLEKSPSKDPEVSQYLADRSNFSKEDLIKVEQHHGINLMQGKNIQAIISNGLER